MKHTILDKNKKYLKIIYNNEPELTEVFSKNYQNIISDTSYWMKIEKKLKSKRFKNFKHSIGDGFLLVWDNPSTPILYIVEVELETHPIKKHILPQLGNFITFSQSAPPENLNEVRNYLYEEIKKNKTVFAKIKKDTGKEVYKVLDNAIEELQILLVIDRIKPELSIGLSQIERAIRVKIRKIEVSVFKYNKDNVILINDSEIAEDERISPKDVEEYTLDYHLENKPEKIKNIINSFLKHIKPKGIDDSPMKYYIGYLKNKKMIFSCVVRKNSVVFYSKAKINEIKVKTGRLAMRDVRRIGHYTNHLPTEIVITEPEQMDDLLIYFDKVYNKF